MSTRGRSTSGCRCSGVAAIASTSAVGRPIIAPECRGVLERATILGVRVRVEEQVSIPAPVAEVWDFVWQTEQLAACVPGCTGVETLEPGKRYRATMSDHIGPYKIEAEMEIVVEEA